MVATASVPTRTRLLVARFRYHLHIAGADAETILCEDSPLLRWYPSVRSSLT